MSRGASLLRFCIPSHYWHGFIGDLFGIRAQFSGVNEETSGLDVCIGNIRYGVPQTLCCNRQKIKLANTSLLIDTRCLNAEPRTRLIPKG